MVDVARIAGVSVSTVSHVLNGTRFVQEPTRDRVLQAVAESGYRQDALARAMRRSQTETLGVVVSDAGEPAFAEMVRGVHEAAEAQGLTLLVANSDEDGERELRAVRALLARRVDGLVLARVADSSEAVLEELQAASVPFVLMDRLTDLELDQVGTENRRVMRELVEHLAARGHERFLLVVGDTRVPPLRERLEAFLEAVEGEALDPALQTVVDNRSKRQDLTDAVDAGLREGHATAMIACSTFLAARGLEVLQRRGIAIPRDLAFATFDGFAYADLFSPHLTTVRQPAFDVGAEAVRLITTRLADPDRAPTTIRLEPTIEYRDSTTTELADPTLRTATTRGSTT
jgi:LacI family transcriptional regulator